MLTHVQERPVREVLMEFGTDATRGLTDEAVLGKRARFGRNELASARRTAWGILLAQVRNPFIYILVGASVLAFMLGEPLDACFILLFIGLNTLLGFYQEYHSERTLELLRTYSAARARVVRNGTELMLPASELVPGDIVLLETGDKIPADVRFIEVSGLIVDESVLTGESVAVVKDIVSDRGGSTAMLGFSGTSVSKGTARAVVVATGNESTIGKIGTLGTHHTGTYERSVARFSAFILRLVVATLLLVFLAHLVIRGSDVDIPNLLLFSVALAVGVIPEALPVVTTFTLSRAARKLAGERVVVRRLSAVEDLGAIEILCTDKTGTITENKLTVAHTYGDHADVLSALNRAAEEDVNRTEPFDQALFAALTEGEAERLKESRVLAAAPFDPRVRFNATVREEHRTRTLFVRGAPEALIPWCHLSEAEEARIRAWCSERGRAGERVLAVATRTLGREDVARALEAPDKLSFVGIASFLDPVKPSTKAAIAHARTLGLRVAIITGDSAEVAGAVAYGIGLTDSPDRVLHGEVFAGMGAREKRDTALGYSVFARFTPEQKYELIELMEERFSVGFLGEGINDVPALKTAGVSIVVESAADIARDAADIVLLEKSLEVVVDGIRAGRVAVANTSKYIKATLASSFGNFYAVAIVSLFVDFLPMLPVQLLLLNLLSDFPMIAIAADTVDKAEVAAPPATSVRDILFVATLLGVVSTFFDFVFFGLFRDAAPAVLQTNWFIGSALTELAFLFSIRTHLPFYKGTRPPASILVLTGIAAIAVVTLPFLGMSGELFRFVAPTAPELALILGVVVVYFATTEAAKLLYYRVLAPKPHSA